MFLKRLEIIGFKSFAERIGIDFVPGVTAVVGPNGSGKSNITDAIRWVLGEQSAKSLRGAKMEDVIFAGSDSRKPLNFAEVTLVLDNSKGLFPLDYTEISVSRRVFRSGESAYVLNGQQCRLKDITDVFMDSGLGKDAFSIISQGRVDEILNSRPEERRNIFDEAAGVLKYKTRKRKAEHKLFETEDNLNRVLDILKELDDRMGPLQKSAEAAEKHEALSDELRNIDVQLLNYDASMLRAELIRKSDELEQLRQQKEVAEQATIEQEIASDELKKQLAALDEQLERLQQRLVHFSGETEKWEGRRLLSMEKQKNSSEQMKRLQEEKQLVERRKEELAEKRTVTERKLQTIQSEAHSLVKEMNDISQMLKRSVTETEAEIEELKSTYIDLLNEEATVRNELKHTNERLEGEQSTTAKLVHQASTLQEKVSQLTREQQHYEKEHVRVQKLAAAVEAEQQTTASQLQQEEAVLAEQQTLLQQGLNRQHEMHGRLRALESMEADFSGFYSGVKEVLLAKKAGQLTGIDGAVAELITVQPGHLKAIETALGGAMQHLITKTEQDARKAIGYLKQKNAGRATFLPRDVMKSRKIGVGTIRLIEAHPQFVGAADQLVTTNEQFSIIKENLLGNTIVAQSLAGASEIAKIVGYKFRIVTLDGDVVNAGGSLTGGGSKGQTTVFSRKAELDMLKQQLAQMATTIEVANRMIGNKKMEVAKWMQEANELQLQKEQAHRELVEITSQLRATTMSLQAAQAEVEMMEQGRLGAKDTETALLEKRQRLQERHREITDQLTKLQEDIEALERLAADRRTEEATLQEQYNRLRERQAVLKEQQANQQQLLKTLNEEYQQYEKRTMTLEEELHFLAHHDQELELTPEQIEQQIKQAETAKQAIEIEYQEKRALRSTYASELAENEIALRHLRDDARKQTAALNELSVSASKVEVKYEALCDRLLDEYGLYPDFKVPDSYDELQARQMVGELKRSLQALGPVNPTAIEEYAEVSERHAFLTEQRNDLVEAKNTLQEAMIEMDSEMKHRFETTFFAIQERFQHVFREMFGGGNADLVLTEPNDLLETGVEIVARPPGKKLQNLSLLSGGERALTAIALLFSIIEVRPVPFCILDEVEAALDEANVIRYSKYLKKFSERTQFIVITHRKGTMEGADVLYGVTMQESGVSRLISVKLSEVPAEAIG